MRLTPLPLPLPHVPSFPDRPCCAGTSPPAAELSVSLRAGGGAVHFAGSALTSDLPSGGHRNIHTNVYYLGFMKSK